MSLNLSAISLGVNSYLMNSVNHDISHRNRMFNEMKFKKKKKEENESVQDRIWLLISHLVTNPSRQGLIWVALSIQRFAKFCLTLISRKQDYFLLGFVSEDGHYVVTVI